VVIDSANVTTTVQSNARGLVINAKTEGASGARTTTYQYDGHFPSNETIQEGSWKLTRVRTFDDRGRVLTENESWTGSGSSYSYATTADWSDPLNPKISRSWGGGQRDEQLSLDGFGNVIGRTLGGVTESFVYTAQGNRASEQIGDRTSTTFEYETSGRLKT